MLYLLITTLSTLVGALTGLGGGVFIKPLLDALSPLDPATVGILSSFCVLTMSILAIARFLRQKIPIGGKLVLQLSLAATFGGMGGKALTQAAAIHFGPDGLRLLQNFFLATLMAMVLLYMLRYRKTVAYNLQNTGMVLLVGLLLGLLSSFLGIGGGPINVAALCLLFAMDVKGAAVHSIAIIFFSQSAKLLTTALGEGFGAYDLTLLLWMLPGAIAGGLLGAALHRHLPENTLLALYNAALLFIIALSSWNILTTITPALR